MNNQKNIHRKIEILDWCIIFAVVIMFFMIYIPASIWEEESQIRKEARHRMSAIANAQEFYKELTGKYTMNGEHMFDLVEAAMDSLIADSLFLGEKIINLESKINIDGSDSWVNVEYPVNMAEGFETRVDTTFSQAQNIKITYLDTTYTIIKESKITKGILDTSFINGIAQLKKEMLKSSFKPIIVIDGDSLSSIIDTVENTKTRIETDYLRLKYHLSDTLLYCPITNEKYFFHIVDKEIIINDDVKYIVKGNILKENDKFIVLQTRADDIKLDNSNLENNEYFQSDKALKLYDIMTNSASKGYKEDLLSQMKDKGTLSEIDKHNMLTITIDKDSIIESNDIEESIFLVDTPLPKDYKETRFVIFSFESGDHGRIIDGSTSWSE